MVRFRLQERLEAWHLGMCRSKGFFFFACGVWIPRTQLFSYVCDVCVLFVWVWVGVLCVGVSKMRRCRGVCVYIRKYTYRRCVLVWVR